MVHGPILSMLMLDLYQRQVEEKGDAFAGYTFDYRGLQPAFVNRDITICGSKAEGGAELHILNDSNQICMSASVRRTS